MRSPNTAVRTRTAVQLLRPFSLDKTGKLQHWSEFRGTYALKSTPNGVLRNFVLGAVGWVAFGNPARMSLA